MTTEQDTPVGAAQPATDVSSQEVSKPKRTTTARSKAKTAAKPASGKPASAKAATGKAASKASESTPTQDAPDSGSTRDSKVAPSSKAAQADSSPTPASKAAATAKAAGRSAGKTAKAPAAKGKKSADASKEISGNTTDAPASASADAPKLPAKASGKPADKAGASSRATSRAAAPRKAKATGAKASAKTAKSTEVSAIDSAADTTREEAAPPKAAAKTPRSRAARSGTAKSSAKANAADTAKPAQQAPRQPLPAEAALASAALAGSAPAKAADEGVKSAPEHISDKPAETAGRQQAPEARAQNRGAANPAAQAAEQAAEQVAEQTADQAANSPAAGEAAAGDSPRRKNRRGRRGGRGRNRKKEQNGQDAAQTAEGQASTAPLAEDTEDFDMTEDALEQAARALEARPQNTPRQNKQPKPGKAQQPKPEGGKPADAAKAAEGKAANTKASAEGPKGKRRMFISVLPGEQVEVALAEDGQLLEYYLDMLHQRKIKGNIYKGVIHNIDTNLQAAFVSYGAGKNGFLQIDEVHPEYWLAHHEPTKGKKFPPIQKVLKAGQEVLVQVVKEPTGSKGAFLTTWLSLAGRFLVLTPGQDQIGVSRKVDDDDERTRLREMMNGIDPGQGLGVIVRTVSAGTTKTTLKNDLQYLKRVWRDIRKKATEVSAPTLIYQEPGLSERAVRDYLTEDVSEIWVDNDEVAQSVRDTVNLLFPRRKDLVRMHTDMRSPMWERFNLRRQLEQIYSREVLLPSGGRLVFDQTEALMAIDINSGKISGKGNFEAMAHKTNMEAAEAIARHLKLRDIGGQVVIDFIEMRDKKHVLEVEKTLRTAMKNDRARHDVSRMSSFGLLELVRQRTGSSALAISLEPCPACGGTGMRRNIEWQALQALRELRRMMSAEPKEKCVYAASPELALYLLNHKRDTLREIEQDYGKCLEIMVRP